VVCELALDNRFAVKQQIKAETSTWMTGNV
jgi:hypothetical protein